MTSLPFQEVIPPTAFDTIFPLNFLSLTEIIYQIINEKFLVA
ncbi:MAG: hypothetical protein RXQ80_08465 [Sulfolobaceae archaeon]